MRIFDSALRLPLAGLVCAALLSACGGGGGGGGGGAAGGSQSDTPDNSWLQLTPSSIELTAYEGDSLTFTISGKSSKTFTKLINIGVVDPVGVVTTDVSINAISQLEYAVTLHTASTLTPGVHSTKLEVRLCEDDPAVCKTPVAGSPWFVPIKLTVNAGTNLTALPTLAQPGAWSTYQGNAAHTGYVPASFAPAQFLRRWTRSGSMYGSDFDGLAIDGGLVFNTNARAANGGNLLTAISEDSGQEVWRAELGTLNRVNAPAVANGKVYLTSTGHQDAYFWVFDQKTGALLSKTSMFSQWDNYRAPTIFGSDVYTDSGYYGGMSKFDAGTYQLGWEIGLPQYDGWTPAVDGSYAYTYVGMALYAIGVADGSVAYSVADPDSRETAYAGVTPMLSGKQMAYVVDGGRAVAFDLAARSLAWTVSGAVGTPAYAKDAVYLLSESGSVLEAHSADKGALLWTSNPLLGTSGETAFKRVIVTDNLAFVSSAQSTLAIDLSTHKTVWQYPLGGDITISNHGVLYIMALGGKIVAINLQ